MFFDAVFVGQNGLLRFLFGLLTSKKNMKKFGGSTASMKTDILSLQSGNCKKKCFTA
jgi:hypothetical protein